ncbi:hypothetical protein [Spelaeibacter cavernicola]|uniref:Uncharacterized protein n=1 Tax=Antrihabitans cavernicola TaxID=2495913 RepID=A0A5A7S536_9NOCA|nr:hypothetical protein [Spelaeibacter cavernicola]KAA0021290.1 hypothetical protein FOY51_20240 [Spelaeibacter cavernicola]
MDLDGVADELYSVDPSEFVEVRTAKVTEARAAGDKALAAAIGKLRKPTTVAWVVNLLSRELPDEIDALLELAGALRDAQRHLSGADLRRLSAQRQQLVRALAKKAGSFAADRDRPITEDMVREVGQTLHAALADPTVSEQVRLGRLVTAANYSGFGPTGLAAVADQPEPVPEPEAVPKKKKNDRSALIAAAKAELDEATEAVEEATAARESAQAEVDDAQTRLTDLEEHITDLRADLERAEQEAQFARSAQKAAADDAKKADKELRRAQSWSAKVQAILEDLS